MEAIRKLYREPIGHHLSKKSDYWNHTIQWYQETKLDLNVLASIMREWCEKQELKA